MEEKDIRKYAQLMKELELTGLEVNDNGKTIRLERSVAVTSPTVPVVVSETTTPVVAPSPVKTEGGQTEDICSPMVGAFYRAPAENQPPYVSVGDRVRKGDVICIIESMKLMNEITSEFDGVITEICVENQQVVDYGQVLFRIQKEEA